MRRHFRFEDGNVVKQVETLLPYKYLDLKKPEIEVQVQEKEDAGKDEYVFVMRYEI